MRITGILVDRLNNVVGYVLFSQTKDFGSLFKCFNVNQIKFLLQSKGDIENATLENGVITFLENSESKFPRYDVQTGSAKNGSEMRIIVCSKEVGNPVKFKVLLLGHNINQCVPTTITEDDLNSHVASNQWELVNAKIVQDMSTNKTKVQGIRWSIPEVEPASVTQPQTTSQSQTPPQPQTPSQSSKTEDKPSAEDRKQWRYKKAENKVYTETAKEVANFCYIYSMNHSQSGIHLPSPSRCPGRRQLTYIKVLKQLALRQVKTEDEKIIVEDAYKKLVKALVENSMYQRPVMTQEYTALLIQYLLRDANFVTELKEKIQYAECKHIRNASHNYEVTATKGIGKNSIAEVIVNNPKTTEKFRKFLKQTCIAKYEWSARWVSVKDMQKVYILESCDKPSTFYDYKTKRKIVNASYKWRDIKDFESVVSTMDDIKAIPIAKMAYVYLKRLSSRDFSGLYCSGGTVNEVVAYMAAKTVAYLDMMKALSANVFNKFISLYAIDLQIVGIDSSTIQGISDTSEIQLTHLGNYSNTQLNLFDIQFKVSRESLVKLQGIVPKSIDASKYSELTQGIMGLETHRYELF